MLQVSATRMNKDFVKADNHNLPTVDLVMANDFFVKNSDFINAEVKNVKVKR